MLLFTVYTPTYNRAHTLHRVFESLQAQTCRDFEWLVVDDGSTDGTAELMRRFQAEARFPLRYMREPHRGAHHAHNVSLREARGEFWLKLDSDDACVPQALEKLLGHWENIPPDQRHAFSGVTGLCKDQNGYLVGLEFPQNPLDCTAAELEYLHKVHGEKWGFLRLEVVRRFPYPENVSGNFIPESFIWCQVSREYKTRHINEPLRVYWMDAPSLVHGAARRDPRTNAAGHRLMFKMVLDLESGWFFTAPFRLMRAAVQYGRFAFLTGMGVTRQPQELSTSGGRALWLAALPLAAALWLRDAALFPEKVE